MRNFATVELPSGGYARSAALPFLYKKSLLFWEYTCLDES